MEMKNNAEIWDAKMVAFENMDNIAGTVLIKKGEIDDAAAPVADQFDKTDHIEEGAIN